jgi:hypothetical protein
MNNKIILNNGQEFDLPPLAIISNDITKRRKITFMSELDYNDVLALLSDKNNISQITYALENGTVIAVYQDCVSLKSLTMDFEHGTYTVEYGTDATERIVRDLQARVEQMQQTIDALTKNDETEEVE